MISKGGHGRLPKAEFEALIEVVTDCGFRDSDATVLEADEIDALGKEEGTVFVEFAYPTL